MADQQHGAGIVGEPFLQQVERLQVQIVGRLIEHQQVGRPSKRASQRQPGALPAGQRANRGSSLLGTEQKILHIADHVPALVADHYRIAAATGQRIAETGRRIEGFAPLVERDLGEVGAEPHLACVRDERTGQQIEQGRLAGAVGSDDAHAIAAQDAGGEVVHNRAAAIGFRDTLCGRDEAAG